MKKLLSLALLASLSVSSIAQESSIMGMVSYPPKKAAANVKVMLSSNQLSEKQKTLTNESGLFTFDKLDTGVYTISIHQKGYNPIEKEVLVRSGEKNLTMAGRFTLDNDSVKVDGNTDKAEALKGRNVEAVKNAISAQSQNQDEKIIEKWGASPAPQFSLSDLSGNTWTNESIKGKATVINFWHTGCRPCIKEMPDLNKWMDEHPNANYLSCTWNSAKAIEEVVSTRPFLFNHMVDGMSLFNAFGVAITPTTIILDKKGIVRMVVTGTSEEDRANMIAKIKELTD